MGNTITLPASVRDINEDLDALHGMLCIVAQGDPPPREIAVTYANCRARLLASSQGKMLPGFLYQCATINRFRDFIYLYDPEIPLRVSFIERMIDRARPAPVPQHSRPEPRFDTSAASWEF